MRIGNIDFSIDFLGKLTKEEFIEMYRGKLNVDINKAANDVSKHFKKEEVLFCEEVSTSEPQQSITKSKRRRRK